MDAESIIAGLGLEPHPEGGHYRETYRDRRPGGGRGRITAIYDLLKGGEVSAWHRIDAVEIWHYYAGAPLELTLANDAGDRWTVQLGAELRAGQRPQAIVESSNWQSARSLGDWTLVGCSVAPAFEFEGFELAPSGWEPGSDKEPDRSRHE